MVRLGAGPTPSHAPVGPVLHFARPLGAGLASPFKRLSLGAWVALYSPAHMFPLQRWPRPQEQPPISCRGVWPDLGAVLVSAPPLPCPQAPPPTHPRDPLRPRPHRLTPLPRGRALPRGDPAPLIAPPPSPTLTQQMLHDWGGGGQQAVTSLFFWGGHDTEEVLGPPPTPNTGSRTPQGSVRPGGGGERNSATGVQRVCQACRLYFGGDTTPPPPLHSPATDTRANPCRRKQPPHRLHVPLGGPWGG